MSSLGDFQFNKSVLAHSVQNLVLTYDATDKMQWYDTRRPPVSDYIR